MRKLVLLILLGLVVVLFLVTYWLFSYSGLRHYLAATYEISRLTGEEKVQAKYSFGGAPEEGVSVYGGILGPVNSKGSGGVWVWGNKGPRYFRADKYSVYSFFSVCNEEALAMLEKGEEIGVGPSIDTDIGSWAEKVKQGDYVVVIIAGKVHRGTPGNLREIKANDWWPFVPLDIKKQCEKR